MEPFTMLLDSTCVEMKSEHPDWTLFRSTYGQVVQSCISHSDCSPIKAPYVPAHIFDPTLRLRFINNTESAYFFMSRSSYTVSFFMETKCYVRNLTTRENGVSLHYYCHFYEKMRWLDTRKMPKRSSQVTIENTLRCPPSFFWQALRDSSSQVIITL